MDRLIYTAMTGASQSLDQQAIVANNLANASTTGFRAQLATYRAVPMNFGDGSAIDRHTEIPDPASAGHRLAEL